MCKKHKIIIISIAIVILILLGVGAFYIYKNYSVNKIVNKAIEYIDEKEYDKAIATLNIALDEKSNDSKAVNLKDMINTYLEAKKLYEDNNLNEANSKINEIKNYSNYTKFKDDVNSLKENINSGIKKIKEIDSDLSKIRDLINKNKFNQAKDMLDKLEKEKLSKIQKQQVSDLKGRVNSELSKKKEQLKVANNEDFGNGKFGISLKEAILQAREKDPHNKSFPISAEDAAKYINEKMGKKNDAVYYYTDYTGAQATMFYRFREFQNNGRKGPYYLVSAENYEILTDNFEPINN